MPYHWTTLADDSAQLRLWPNRSLPRAGFVAFIGGTSALIALPLLAVLGTAILWVLLPFLMLAVGAVWWALERSYADGRLVETLTITPADTTLRRQNPRQPDQTWQAQTYWVQVKIHPIDGPVDHYLTLKGGEREVEIGAFLSSEERQTLHQELVTRFRAKGVP